MLVGQCPAFSKCAPKYKKYSIYTRQTAFEYKEVSATFCLFSRFFTTAKKHVSIPLSYFVVLCTNNKPNVSVYFMVISMRFSRTIRKVMPGAR